MRSVRVLPILFALPMLVLASSAPAQAPYASRVADHNRVGLTVSNHGAFGNNFISRSPSFEFPLGTGYEHLTHAGIWIGARARHDNVDRIGVSTAAYDGAIGQNTSVLTEFSAFTGFTLRSSLAQSPHYDPAAVSELDILSSYRDQPGQRLFDPHVPLGIHVDQEVYAWSDDYVIVRLRLRATGDPLRDLFVGLYSELASGPRNLYASWPPSAASGGPLGTWFSKKLLRWDPARRLLAEHYCNRYPTCSYEIVPPWAGIVVLGSNPPAGQPVGLKIWNYAPGDTARDVDAERYSLLSSPHQTPADSLLPGFAAEGSPNDPAELLGVGPFDLDPAAVAPQAAIEVAFAFVGGETFDALLAAADRAQAVHDANYQPPTPTRLSLVDAEAGEGSVRLRWHSALDAGRTARIERSLADGHWTPIGDASVDAGGLLVYEDRDVRPGLRYGYRAGIQGDTETEWTDPVWIDVPASNLTLGFPAGTRRVMVGALDVEFSLPGSGPAHLEAFDVQGRRVAATELDGIGPGTGRARLAEPGTLPPGVYFLRLSQGNARASARTLLLDQR